MGAVWEWRFLVSRNPPRLLRHMSFTDVNVKTKQSDLALSSNFGANTRSGEFVGLRSKREPFLHECHRFALGQRKGPVHPAIPPANRVAHHTRRRREELALKLVSSAPDPSSGKSTCSG